jgi:lipopolysaccharide assembly protein A
MRYLRYVFLGLLGLALFLIAFANRGPVELRLLPEELSALWQGTTSMTLPLFVVILASVVVGVILGFLWEWLREHKYRAAARSHSREAAKLKREVDRIKGQPEVQGDAVLKLLDG